MNPFIRNASISDLNAINYIYNYYVLNSTSTAQESISTLSERKEWFNDLTSKGLPVIVAEINGDVVGWGSLTLFNERSAYRFCVENSVYISKDNLCCAIGTTIMNELIKKAKESNYKIIFAKICAEQKPSIRFHEKFGFRKVGLLENAIFKFERFADIVIMQKDI